MFRVAVCLLGGRSCRCLQHLLPNTLPSHGWLITAEIQQLQSAYIPFPLPAIIRRAYLVSETAHSADDHSGASGEDLVSLHGFRHWHIGLLDLVALILEKLNHRLARDTWQNCALQGQLCSQLCGAYICGSWLLLGDLLVHGKSDVVLDDAPLLKQKS